MHDKKNKMRDTKKTLQIDFHMKMPYCKQYSRSVNAPIEIKPSTFINGHLVINVFESISFPQHETTYFMDIKRLNMTNDK